MGIDTQDGTLKASILAGNISRLVSTFAMGGSGDFGSRDALVVIVRGKAWSRLLYVSILATTSSCINKTKIRTPSIECDATSGRARRGLGMYAALEFLSEGRIHDVVYNEILLLT
jgi:hypothetical protein